MPIAARDRLLELEPDFAALKNWSANREVNGAYAYTLNKEGAIRISARAWNPLSGQNEDAATGVAAAALVLALRPRFKSHVLVVIEQGINSLGNHIYVKSLSASEALVGGRIRTTT